MAYTQEQLDAMRATFAKGQRRVKYGDKEVEYASLDELRRAIETMEAQVEGEARRGKKRVIIIGRKGL